MNNGRTYRFLVLIYVEYFIHMEPAGEFTRYFGEKYLLGKLNIY